MFGNKQVTNLAANNLQFKKRIYIKIINTSELNINESMASQKP